MRKFIICILAALIISGCAGTLKTEYGDISLVLNPADIENIISLLNTKRAWAPATPQDLIYKTEAGEKILIKALPK